MKEKIDQSGFIKIKKCFSVKGTVKCMKIHATGWENIFSEQVPVKDLYSKFPNDSKSSTRTKPKIQLKYR